MIANLPSTIEQLIIQEKSCFSIENYQLEVTSYLGSFSPGVNTFKVNFYTIAETEPETKSEGLLRVGSLDSGLHRELELRSLLNNYGLVAPLLAQAQIESVLVNTQSSNPLEVTAIAITGDPITDDGNTLPVDAVITNLESTESASKDEQADAITHGETSESQEIPLSSLDQSQNNSQQQEQCTTDQLENNSQQQEQRTAFSQCSESENHSEETRIDYLPEEIIEDEPQLPSTMIFLLTEFPSLEDSLENLLKDSSLSEKTLNLVIQICQLCSYLSDKKWNLINLVTPLIEYKERLKFYDLTQILPQGETLPIGLVGGYYAPELATASLIDPLMSSYTVGALLYQILHQNLPNTEHNFDFPIHPIPRFYQILKIALDPDPQGRFPLSQLRYLLLEARQELYSQEIHWKTASASTVGLSLSRLQNEDNFGIRQQHLNSKEKLMLAVVADGMGGMAKGEIASKIAVETLLGEAIPPHFQTPEQRDTWLTETFQKANQAIAAEVDNGGTTLSVVLACNDKLMISHVGDSRIYLLRQGKIQQLSQDHSLVGLMVNNGEITEEESRNHPDRNVLLRSLGSKNSLSPGYVQNLTVTTKNLALSLESQDILLLCSDGVWDLVRDEELQTMFSFPSSSLQDGVDTIIQKVLDAGASDNATLVALQYSTSSH
jgi:serine/threonine protein phosphatase PrpC